MYAAIAKVTTFRLEDGQSVFGLTEGAACASQPVAGLSAEALAPLAALQESG
jgi:hypothetical protein